jgi:hypothetical protein
LTTLLSTPAFLECLLGHEILYSETVVVAMYDRVVEAGWKGGETVG